jgi:ABC-2 type transport system permease protein
MKNSAVQFLRILRHECLALTLSPFVHLTYILFLVLMGALYISIIHEYSSGEQYTLPTTLFFQTFWLPNLMTVPILTMRSFAENRRTGALDTMLATPIGAGQWVALKFIAIYLAYALLWGLTCLYPWLTRCVLSDTLNAVHLTSWGAWLGGYSFILLSGLLFVAIGICLSALAQQTMTAAIGTFFALLACLISVQLLPKVTGLDTYIHPRLKMLLAYGDLFQHLEAFCTGLLDTRPIVLCVTSTVLILWLSAIKLKPHS